MKLYTSSIFNAVMFTIVIICFTIRGSASPLFFTCDSSGNWDIFFVNENGSGLKRVTDSQYDEKSIALSPDRKKLITACSDGWIRIINTDSYTVSDSFTTRNKPGTANLPQFYDSSEVIFIELIDSKRDLWVIQQYNKGTINTLIQMYGSLFYPTAIPGTRSIVYTYNTCTSGCNTMITELWYYNALSRVNRQMTLLNTHISSPVFIDNENCIFSAVTHNISNLYCLNLHSSVVKPLVIDTLNKISPAVSPEKNKLSFIVTKSDKTFIKIINIFSGKAISTLSPCPGRFAQLAW